MSCWALVAAKARPARKERLAGRLSLSERDQLAEAMLQDVLAALRESHSLDGIALVTADTGRVEPQVLVLPDPGTGLNDALASAARSRVSTRDLAMYTAFTVSRSSAATSAAGRPSSTTP